MSQHLVVQQSDQSQTAWRWTQGATIIRIDQYAIIQGQWLTETTLEPVRTKRMKTTACCFKAITNDQIATTKPTIPTIDQRGSTELGSCASSKGAIGEYYGPPRVSVDTLFYLPACSTMATTRNNTMVNNDEQKQHIQVFGNERYSTCGIL